METQPDQIVFRRIEARTVEEVRLKNGQPVARFVSTLSEAGDSSVLQRYRIDEKRAAHDRGAVKYTRVAPVPPGTDPASGKFRRKITLEDMGSDARRIYELYWQPHNDGGGDSDR